MSINQNNLQSNNALPFQYDIEYYGKRRSLPDEIDFSTYVDLFNRKTILTGATKEWDKKRLIEGKFSSLKEIGGSSVLLKSSLGDKISGFFFTLENFLSKLKATGAKFVRLNLKVEHPFFQMAKPISISRTNPFVEGVRIPYDPSVDLLFKKPTGFLNYCNKLGYTAIWEDSFEPVEPSNSWSLSSRKQNIIVICKVDYEWFKKNGSPKDIEEQSKFNPLFDLFSGGNFTGNAIEFTGDPSNLKKLLEDLKIEKTPWEFVELNGKTFLVDSKNQFSAKLAFLENRGLFKDSTFHCDVEELPEPPHPKAGVVVLSMNQSNSFTQYTHEILTFLMEGVNVLVYDNAGKGLSEGHNTEQGLRGAVDICGDFLEYKGFSESQIIFKGQCAGGLPTSQAAKDFPNAHVWIDQAPQNFSDAAGQVCSKKLEHLTDNPTSDSSSFKKGLFSILNKTAKYIAPLVAATSNLVFPSFDVVENLKENKGVQIYTIGVPDEFGKGGDDLVPKIHVKQISESIQSRKNGVYLPMPGAIHVTDWWTDPNVRQKVSETFKKASLSYELFQPSKKQAAQIPDPENSNSTWTKVGTSVAQVAVIGLAAYNAYLQLNQ